MALVVALIASLAITGTTVAAPIDVSIKNTESSDYTIHVFDLFGGGRNEVTGSPFALASGEVSKPFSVNASANGEAIIEFSCEGGPSLSAIVVHSGDVYEIR
jgi:hypothetical protein